MSAIFANPPLQPQSSLNALKQVRLSGFRSYKSLSVTFEARSVVLVGPNGAGKTNLLEALSFFSPGRGFRGAALGDILRKGQDEPLPWGVSVVLQDEAQGDNDLSVGLDPQLFSQGREKKTIRLNGGDSRSQTALSEYLTVLWLTPSMDRLFMEGASSRRRFWDRLVFALDRTHATRLNCYEQALRERNRVLKDAKAWGRLPGSSGSFENVETWLDGLEDRLAEEGVYLSQARLDFLDKMRKALSVDRGPFPRPYLDFMGDIEADLKSGLGVAEAKAAFKKRLSLGRNDDALRGMTRCGPHRSDLKVLFEGENGPAADTCSTGEQKALLLSLVMAAARVQRFYRTVPLILLLDEVVAHLDEARRKALFDEILNLKVQAWMTGTDASLFQQGKDIFQFFKVQDNCVSELRNL